MTSEKKLETAKKEQQEVAKPPVKYYKCVCEKCGHTFFVDANDTWSIEAGLDKTN